MRAGGSFGNELVAAFGSGIAGASRAAGLLRQLVEGNGNAKQLLLSLPLPGAGSEGLVSRCVSIQHCQLCCS
jgi:hypothetical protein